MTPPPLPSYAEALRVWLRVGLLSFGGPAAQIAVMHKEIVDERAWVSDRRFLHALNFCTLLPGPEAQQLATYLGWLMHGVRGGLTAGLLFILPGAVVMLALSAIYAGFGQVPVVSALFFGLKAAVLVLVVEALLRLAKRALKGVFPRVLAVVAFVALFAFDVPFPVVVLAAGVVGFFARHQFAPASHGKAADGPPSALDAILDADPGRMVRMAGAAWRAGWIAVGVWLLPVALLWAAGAGVFADVAVYFSQMAMLTFGGAYAVLAWVAQSAVETYGWLSAQDMLAGLGLAETTPGPLILVLQFVGFLAGHQAHGMLGGVAASILTLWVTFVPCFAWIFLGAPFVERLHGQTAMSGALAAVTAAVVGVIANLSVWFGLRVLFANVATVPIGPMRIDVPVLASADLGAWAIAILAALCVFRFRLGVGKTLGLAALAGLVLRWIGM
ncbi:chromate efflux transporter [Humitalea sp. 24SJ18S-53]|uniref:chromate efflux transporter n=1 Tax=Humitalea sp. 24SJ18S-53 TaxID=3422307 RepID=UPI003D6784C9